MSRLALFSVLTAVLTSMFSCWETPESQYADSVEAGRDGAISRGWIPEWIPSGATNIREIHDIDTNQVWLVFDAPSAELVAIETHCERMSTPPERYPRRIRKWWPSTLSRREPSPPDEYLYLRCETGFIAIDLESGRAYYWRTSA
jgi:hypothetical protein